MVKKSIIIILTLLVVLTMVGCSNKAQQEEIDALKAEIARLKKENQKIVVTAAPTPEIPTYKVEGNYLTDVFITITSSSYTDEGLAILCSEVVNQYDGMYFFMPNAPRKKYHPLDKKKLPDDDYCIAAYSKNSKGKWKKKH